MINVQPMSAPTTPIFYMNYTEEEMAELREEIKEIFGDMVKITDQNSSRYTGRKIITIHISKFNKLEEEDIIFLIEYGAVLVQYFEKKPGNIKASPKRKYLTDYLKKFDTDMYNKYKLIIEGFEKE